MGFQHKTLASGRWFELSLAEQLGNICSEVGRAHKLEGQNSESFWQAVTRALELLDLTLIDRRWAGRYMEIARAREVFADALLGGQIYKSSLEDMERYFMNFAMLARRKA